MPERGIIKPERGIIKPEVELILTEGHHEAKKDQFNEEFQSWDYAIKGKTMDGRILRVVVALVQPNVFVITTIDLGL
jgi:phage terminase large subunit-like protein